MADDIEVTASWRVDRTWSRPGDGAWVSGGTPRRLWRLGNGGRRVVDAHERGLAPPRGHEPLTRRLVDAGALHPQPMAIPPLMHCDVVIPTLNTNPDALRRVVRELRHELGPSASIVIVDDAAASPVSAVEGARVIRNTQRLGPAHSRNEGAAHGEADVVLFVDDDIVLSPGWAAPLLGHLHDPKVGAVAPRIGGPEPGPGLRWWQRSEQVRSPLDLGPEPAPVHPGSRVPYVPSAVLMLRRQAFERAGGFDTELRYGEDVDLVWRLHGAGWHVRYDPRVVAHHEARSTWRGWLAQRFWYGTSAAPLARRHPTAIVAARLGNTHVLVWLLALVGHPIALLAATVGVARSTFALRSMLRARGIDDATRRALHWSADGWLGSAQLCASAVWRPWWPLAAGAAAVSRRGRWLLAIATALRLVDDLAWWRRSRRLDPVRFTLSARLGDLAYGAGVWHGAWRHRTWMPLRLGRALPDKVGPS